jgi:RES domain-containing protein
MFGGRYTPKGGAPAIYLASDPNVALLETNSIFMPPKGPAVMAGVPPMVICQIDVSLTNVLDLTDPAVVASVGSSTQELTGDWRYDMTIGRVPPTQAIGAAAHASGRVSTLLVHSAKAVGSGKVLVVFPDRLTKGTFVRVLDPTGTLVQEILGTL